MSITHWPEAERPREKLLLQGPQNLSDAELIAIFLRTGIKGETAVDLARKYCQQFGGLRKLLDLEQTTFAEQRGLSTTKYVQLQAALEIGRRYLNQHLTQDNLLNNPMEVKRFLTAHLRNPAQEIFACIFLNSRNRMVHFAKLFIGTINQAAVHPREVVKQCLQHHATAVIFAHNHPSGDPTPSQMDIDITTTLKEALALIDVLVLDHLIVGESDILSLAQQGLV